MVMKQHAGLTAMLLGSALVGSSTPIIDFDQSLNIRTIERPFPGRIKHLAYEFITKPAPYTEVLARLRSLYETHKHVLAAPGNTVKIPKIIHQVWLGGPLPAQYAIYQESWLRHHPGWTVIMWTDRTSCNAALVTQYPNYEERHISTLGTLRNQLLVNQAPNYAEKSDILRYEILHRFGGVYVDMDVENFKPLDVLHYGCHFYAGIEPMECGQLVGNAIIAAQPGHPIIEHCITHIQSSTVLVHLNQQFGPGMATVCATGPIALTRAVYHVGAQDDMVNIVLPTSYFYPCGLLRPHQPVRPESFAAHYWTFIWSGSKL